MKIKNIKGIINYELLTFKKDVFDSFYKMKFQVNPKKGTEYLLLKNISKHISIIDKFYYKQKLLKAITLLENSNTNCEIIVFDKNHLNANHEFPIEQMKYYFNEVKDLGVIYKLGNMNSLNLTKDTEIKNFLMNVVHRSKKIMFIHLFLFLKTSYITFKKMQIYLMNLYFGWEKKFINFLNIEI